jgi:DNA repair protein RadC
MTTNLTISEILVSYKPDLKNKFIVRSSNDCYHVLKDWFDADTISLQEQFVVMYLNRGNFVLGIHRLSKGGISGTVADIRLILGIGLKIAASGIVIAHNHPSGNLKPSEADTEITQKLKDAALLMDTRLLDHLVITPAGEYLSMADEGLI